MYTTSADLSAALQRSLTATETEYFDSVLDAYIDEYINQATGTSFGLTNSDSVYVTAPDNVNEMLVIPTMHDISAVVKVNNDDSEEAVSVDDYYTYPRGKDNKYALVNKNGQWESEATYKITGELGYKQIPADIVLVATEIAKNALLENVNNYKSEKVGDWSVTYSDVANSLSGNSLLTLNRYRRISRSI